MGIQDLLKGHLLLVIGLLVFALGTGTQALTTLTVDSTPPYLGNFSPNGTPTQPNIYSIGSGGSLVMWVGEDTNMTTGANCASSPPTNCYSMTLQGDSVKCFPSSCGTGSAPASVTLFSSMWLGGSSTPGIVTCDATTTCTYAVNYKYALTGFCGSLQFCSQFTLSWASTSQNYKAWWLYATYKAYDSAGNVATASGWGFVDAPAGYFLINGQRAFPTSNIVTSSNTVTFQFNATTLPTTINNVNIIVANGTSAGAPTKTLCYIQGTGCFTPNYSGSANFYLFPSYPLYFTSGSYNVTATFSCNGCALPSYRVLSLFYGAGSVTNINFGISLTLYQGVMIAGLLIAALDFFFDYEKVKFKGIDRGKIIPKSIGG